MYRLVSFLCLLYFFALTPYKTSAMTEEQKEKIHQEFHMLGMECLKDHAITESDINDLKSHKLPSGENAPCFLACMMRKPGILNDQGMLESEKALEHAKAFFDDDEEVQRVKEYLHSCSHINSESVGDGTKGCERAFLAYKCMTENAAQFGFDM